MKRRLPLVIAVLIVLGLALVAPRSLGLRSRTPPAPEPPTPPRDAPLTAPAQALTPAPQATPAPSSAPSRPAASQPLSEAQFVDISATIVLGAIEVQHQPDAVQRLEPLLEQALDRAGVSIEEFNAFAERVYSDPRLSERLAEAILDRVEERSSPQVRAHAVPMAQALSARLSGQKPPPR